MAQEQVQKHARSDRKAETVADQSTNDRDKTAEQVKADTDALLDEIDDLLAEQDAEAFVNSYIQKGGQAVRIFLDRVATSLRPVVWRVGAIT